MMKKIKSSVLIVIITLLLLTMLFPLFWMISISLRPEGVAIVNVRDLIPSDITFDNYLDILRWSSFARFFFNSIVVTFFVIIGNLLFASMVGYAFARRNFPGKSFFFIVIIGTIMIPKQVMMIPVYVLISKLHLMNTYPALILPFLVDTFNIFLMRQYIQTLPVELEDAARIDGASDYQVFFRVVMPLAKPALAVLAINTFLVSWNTFLYPLILTNTESMRTLPVGLALYSLGEHSVDWGHLMAGASVSALPIILVFLIFQRYIIEGITAGAVK